VGEWEHEWVSGNVSSMM